MLYQEPSSAFHNLLTDFSVMNIQTNSHGAGPHLSNRLNDSSMFNQNDSRYWQDHYPTANGVPQIGQTFEPQQSSKVRRSSNMTETVPVPSSEHVAEIVGRQGCKIKTLRAKTNTYIKTPIRGAQPEFVITGRQEDVAKAKQEILMAAAHFSQLRSSRQNGINKNAGVTPSSPGSDDEMKTVVRVPYKFVGLVIGPKGTSIKRIQQLTSTRITTPGLNQDPIFEIMGQPHNVEMAKSEIEKHIASRVGHDDASDLQIDNFHVDQTYGQSSESPRSEPSINSFIHVNMEDNLPPLSAASRVVSKDVRRTLPNHEDILNNEAGSTLRMPFDSFIPENVERNAPIGVTDYFTPSSIWADSSSYWTEHNICVQDNEPRSLINPNAESDPIVAALPCFSQSSKSNSGTSSPASATSN